MTKVTIFPVPIENGTTAYYAQSGDKQSVGDTAGAALDAITAQLQDTGRSTVVILQELQPDEFFMASQQRRLVQLMDEWRSRRDSGQALLDSTEQELELLVEAKLSATVERSNKLLDELLNESSLSSCRLHVGYRCKYRGTQFCNINSLPPATP